MLGLSRNQEVKKQICKVLERYKEGKVYTYEPKNAQHQIDKVRPHYHNSVKWVDGGRRYRFNICEENGWNGIELSETLESSIIEEIKKLLEENQIPYKDVRLNSYYPYMESRMQYARSIACLEIYD